MTVNPFIRLLESPVETLTRVLLVWALATVVYIA